MKSLFKKEWRIKCLDSIEEDIRAFSPAERAVFIVAALVFLASVIWIFVRINDTFLIDIPSRGGSFSEAIVGTPRFANPLLAISDSDRDLSSLVYSGLMREMPDGTIIPDLASSYSVSSDGLSYTFDIKENAVFQDGVPVTADDIAFTVLKAQDPALKSPQFANWNGIAVKVVNPKEIIFTLKQPYTFFIYDTTLGILPKHVWQNTTDDNFAFSEYNSSPIGSGPYSVSSISRDSSGVPTEYKLASFQKFALGTPFIENIYLEVFADTEAAMTALKNGSVDAYSGIESSALPISNKDTKTIVSPYTRVFGLFFNQNQNAIFADHAVRTALDISAPKQQIVNSALDGFGQVLNGPTLGNTLLTNTSSSSLSTASSTLAKDGWKIDQTGRLTKASKKSSTPLSFSISTGDVPSLVSTANILKDTWNSLGASVSVKVFNQSDLAQTVIETRNYDALLLGMVVGRHPDLYAFWSSTQRNYPGLNVAEYTNAKADKALNEMRSTSTPATQIADQNKFLSYVASDTPAVFLYSPQFIYAVPNTIKNIFVGPITIPSDRFENVWQWYIDTEKVWGWFIDEHNKN